MNDFIRRDIYLKKLIERQFNGDIKIITGPRRCGKSWLLKKVYRSYLLEQGISEKNIIAVSLDLDEPDTDIDLTKSDNLKKYLYGKIGSSTEKYYVFLDEIQEVEGFERLVNGLAAHDNIDVYITGSNSKFLSSDINTIFRGRGDEIRVNPFAFKEFCQGRNEPVSELWKEYYTYGGMPGLIHRQTATMKTAYLQRLWQKTYLDDVVERNNIRNKLALENLVDALCSAIGSLVNPNKIKNTLQSVAHIKVDNETVNNYLKFLENSFLFAGAKRYNIKGKTYYESLQKYYAADVGLRNARLNFRQQEITHIMENVIYNELRTRDFLIDVGLVESRETINGHQDYRQYEVDFIATNGLEKFYIQSAFNLDSDEKRQQEMASLLKIDDSFRKIVIVGTDIATYTDNHGIVFMGLFQFLQNNGIFE